MARKLVSPSSIFSVLCFSLSLLIHVAVSASVPAEATECSDAEVVSLVGSANTTQIPSYLDYYITGSGSQAYVYQPAGIAISPDERVAVFTQTWREPGWDEGTTVESFDVVRVMSLNTSAGSEGEVYVLAGYRHSSHYFDSPSYYHDSGNFASATAAAFNKPTGVAFSPDGLSILVGDRQNNRIRILRVSQEDDLNDGFALKHQYTLPQYVGNEGSLQVGVNTGTLAGSGDFGFADGTGSAASFAGPEGVVVSPEGSTVYVADTMNHRIRAIDMATGAVQTLAGSGNAGSGDGVGTQASFNSPSDVAVTPDGQKLLVADRLSHAIRAIVISTGAVTTLYSSAANGNSYPNGIAISPDGLKALFTDTYNNQIRAVDIGTGQVTTLAGSPSGSASFADGPASSANFHDPRGIAISQDGKFALVADYENARIRKISLPTGDCDHNSGQGGGDGRPLWLAEVAASGRFSDPRCTESRSKHQLLEGIRADPGLFLSGGLGVERSTETFGVWMCFANHPCLQAVGAGPGDRMCYAEERSSELVHHPWGLDSELGLTRNCASG